MKKPKLLSVLTVLGFLTLSHSASAAGQKKPGPAANPCDSVKTLEAMRVISLTLPEANSLFQQFRGSQEMRGGMIPRDVVNYLVCNGATEIFIRFSIKKDDSEITTVQYIGRGIPSGTVILQPADFVPTCPTMCFD